MPTYFTQNSTISIAIKRLGQISLGTSVRVWGGEGARRVVELTLEQVEEIRISGDIEQFTLHFSGPVDYQLDKNSYKFEHPQSGLFRLWIEPAAIEEEQQWYRADFNQLK